MLCRSTHRWMARGLRYRLEEEVEVVVAVGVEEEAAVVVVYLNRWCH